MSLCAEIAPLNPGDRVCQWYSGLAMLTDTLTEREGLTDPHNALARRVDAVVPVALKASASIETGYRAMR